MEEVIGSIRRRKVKKKERIIRDEDTDLF